MNFSNIALICSCSAGDILLHAFLHSIVLCKLPAGNGRQNQSPREDDPFHDSDADRHCRFVSANSDLCTCSHLLVIDYNCSQLYFHPLRSFLVHTTQTRSSDGTDDLLEYKCRLHPAVRVSDREGSNLDGQSRTEYF